MTSNFVGPLKFSYERPVFTLVDNATKTWTKENCEAIVNQTNQQYEASGEDIRYTAYTVYNDNHACEMHLLPALSGPYLENPQASTYYKKIKGNGALGPFMGNHVRRGGASFEKRLAGPGPTAKKVPEVDTYQSCGLVCLADPTCRGWFWEPNSKSCSLKTAAWELPQTGTGTWQSTMFEDNRNPFFDYEKKVELETTSYIRKKDNLPISVIDHSNCILSECKPATIGSSVPPAPCMEKMCISENTYKDLPNSGTKGSSSKDLCSKSDTYSDLVYKIVQRDYGCKATFVDPSGDMNPYKDPIPAEACTSSTGERLKDFVIDGGSQCKDLNPDLDKRRDRNKVLFYGIVIFVVILFIYGLVQAFRALTASVPTSAP